MSNDNTTTTHALIGVQTGRVNLPIPFGAKRVLMAITGEWGDRAKDPIPARLEVRTIGGPPHGVIAKTKNDPTISPAAKAAFLTELRLSVSGDVVKELPPMVSGVSIEVQRKAPGLNVIVSLVAVDEVKPATAEARDGDQRKPSS